MRGGGRASRGLKQNQVGEGGREKTGPLTEKRHHCTRSVSRWGGWGETPLWAPKAVIRRGNEFIFRCFKETIDGSNGNIYIYFSKNNFPANKSNWRQDCLPHSVQAGAKALRNHLERGAQLLWPPKPMASLWLSRFSEHFRRCILILCSPTHNTNLKLISIAFGKREAELWTTRGQKVYNQWWRFLTWGSSL